MAVLDKNGTEYLWNKAKEKFAAKDDVPETPEGVVLYTEQSLTDSQKAQARGNIGAVGTVEATEEAYTYVFTGEEPRYGEHNNAVYLETVTKEFALGITNITTTDNSNGETNVVGELAYAVSRETEDAVSIEDTNGSLIAFAYTYVDNFEMNMGMDVITFGKRGLYIIDASVYFGVDATITSLTSTVPYSKTTQKIDEALIPAHAHSWEELEGKPFGETLGELCSVENGVCDEANGYVAIENVSGFPKAGEVCTVVINGTLYENVPVSDFYGITVVGDSDFLSSYTPNEDIPFIITSGFFNEYGWDFVDTVGMMNGSLKDSYSVAVYGTVTKQLDEKYVPTPDWEAEEGGKGHILNKPFSAKLHTEHTWDGDISNGVSVIVKEDGNGKQYGYYRISNNVDVGFSNNDGEGYAYYAGGKTAENESIAYSVDLMERVYTKQEVSYYVDEHLKAITPENCVCIRTGLQRTVFGTAFEKGVWLRFVIGEDGNIIEYTSELKHYIINHLATALESPHQRSISVTTNEIYLHSSTSGSTKKFKLTVDDTGTISATEVV